MPLQQRLEPELSCPCHLVNLYKRSSCGSQGRVRAPCSCLDCLTQIGQLLASTLLPACVFACTLPANYRTAVPSLLIDHYHPSFGTEPEMSYFFPGSTFNSFWLQQLSYFFLSFFKKKCLYLFERERKRAQVGEGQRKRETGTEDLKWTLH